MLDRKTKKQTSRDSRSCVACRSVARRVSLRPALPLTIRTFRCQSTQADSTPRAVFIRPPVSGARNLILPLGTLDARIRG